MAQITNGLIPTPGLVLSLRLYHINGGSLGSVSSVVDKLEKQPVEFNREKKSYEGFSEIDTKGSLISVDYTVGQPIRVQRLRDGERAPQSEVVYSQGRCEYRIHIRDKYLECRGTSWVAKKGLARLMELLGVEFEGVTLDEGTMANLCRDAALVKTVKISDLDNPALSQIQLSGEILDSAEWTIYRRQGVIKYFRGFIDLPTGSQISAQIANNGTMLIYKRGEGIPAEDVMSAVDMIKKLA